MTPGASAARLSLLRKLSSLSWVVSKLPTFQHTHPHTFRPSPVLPPAQTFIPKPSDEPCRPEKALAPGPAGVPLEPLGELCVDTVLQCSVFLPDSPPLVCSDSHTRVSGGGAVFVGSGRLHSPRTSHLGMYVMQFSQAVRQDEVLQHMLWAVSPKVPSMVGSSRAAVPWGTSHVQAACRQRRAGQDAAQRERHSGATSPTRSRRRALLWRPRSFETASW